MVSKKNIGNECYDTYLCSVVTTLYISCSSKLMCASGRFKKLITTYKTKSAAAFVSSRQTHKLLLGFLCGFLVILGNGFCI